MTSTRWPLTFIVLLAGCAEGENSISAVKPIAVHPVFQTPVSHAPRSRPAVQVDILDASEHWLLTAELYLTVQSSRFPSETWVVLPLNIGDFQGCRSRFVQLPFEVREGDTLLLNLLDDDRLTADQEKLILKSCAATGYCLLVAGKLHAATTGLFAQGVELAADVLGEVVLDDVKSHGFKNLGKAEFHVPPSLPAQAGEANVLTILDESRYARVLVKLFAPELDIPFATTPAL